jgi:AbrB family looped-hinge helix DNA binding protein
MVTVTVDAKGRLVIPSDVRAELDIHAGDVLFLESDSETKVLHLAKAINPFDGLTDHAINEYRQGRTISLEAYAAEHDIALGDE